MINSGIHHVPNDQKNSVNPFVNPIRSVNAPPTFGIFKQRIEPASVVIATAPILIQYGGISPSGGSL